jgi:hypothetical protein
MLDNATILRHSRNKSGRAGASELGGCEEALFPVPQEVPPLDRQAGQEEGNLALCRCLPARRVRH